MANQVLHASCRNRVVVMVAHARQPREHNRSLVTARLTAFAASGSPVIQWAKRLASRREKKCYLLGIPLSFVKTVHGG